MGLMDNLKQLAGMGLRMEVELPQKFIVAGSSLRFELTLRSEQDTAVREIIAELTSGEAAPGTSGWGQGPVQSEITVASDVSVKADLPHHIAASIDLPADARPTVNDKVGARYWSLRVKADVPNGLDPDVTVGFVVASSCEFEWESDSPVTVTLEDGPRKVSMRGTCMVVQPDDISLEDLNVAVSETINRSLAVLLADRPKLVKHDPLTIQHRREIAGALREVANPLLRESGAVPIDSIAELTVIDVTVE